MEERITTAGVAVRDGMVFVAHREKGGSLSGKWEFPGGVHTESGWVSKEDLRALEMGESDSRIRDLLLHSLE